MHDFDDTVVLNIVAEFKVLLCVLVTVLLTGFQCFSDSEIDGDIVDCFELQWYLWVQYENLMKRGLQIIVLCFRSIQSENVWNVVPGGWNMIVGRRLRTSTTASTRVKGVEAPFQ